MAGAKLTGDLTKRMRRGEKRTQQAVTSTAKDIVKAAKARAPVDTGHLKDSIKADPLDEFQAGVTVDTSDGTHDGYAAYVEYGTRNMAAQPFLTPAVEAAREPFVRKIRKAYDQ